MPNHSKLWPVIGIMALGLASCGTLRQAKPQPAEAPESSIIIFTGTASVLPAAEATLTATQNLVQNLEFSDLKAVAKSARFPVWLPGFVPKGLQFYHACISDYADGSETVSLLFMEPGDPLDANLKSLFIQMTEPGQPFTLDAIFHQFKVTAWDVRAVQVRGQEGFSYWTPSVAAGNSAVLLWHAGQANFQISIYGNWPGPDESHPHALDDLMIKIAESMQTKP